MLCFRVDVAKKVTFIINTFFWMPCQIEICQLNLRYKMPATKQKSVVGVDDSKEVDQLSMW